MLRPGLKSYFEGGSDSAEDSKERCYPYSCFCVFGLYRVRYSAKLKSLKERLIEAGMLTKKQLTAMLGISRTTIGKLRT